MTAAAERPAGRSWVRWAGLTAAVVVVTRLALVAILAAATHGADYADDPAMHLQMTAHPLVILRGDTLEFGQHPVLLPVVEWVLFRPFRWAGAFWSVRLGYLVAEAVLAAALVALLWDGTERTARRVAVLAVASPVFWMTSVVMAQDEVIAAAFLAAALALWVRGRLTAAVAVLGVGVAAAKVFLLLPLLALVVLGPAVARWRRALLGGALALVPYAVAAVEARRRGYPMPLSGFEPGAAFSITPWALAVDAKTLTVADAKAISLPIAAGLALVPLALAWWRGRGVGDGGRGVADRTLGAVTAAMLLWFFVAFYHVNPEYLILAAVPLALAMGVGVGVGRSVVVVHAVLAVPWLVNLFFGVANADATSATGGKRTLADAYHRVIPLDPVTGQRASIVVSSLLLAGLAVGCTVRGSGFRRSTPAD